MIDYLIRLYLRRKLYKELSEIMSRDLYFRGGIPTKTNYQLTYPEVMEMYRDNTFIRISRESDLNDNPLCIDRVKYDQFGYPEVPEILNVGARRLFLKLYNKVLSSGNVDIASYIEGSRFVYRFNYLGIDILEMEVDSNRAVPEHIKTHVPLLIIAGVLNV